MSDAADYDSWVGRTEVRFDVMTASPLDRLNATLDRDAAPAIDGDAAPPLAHWLFFLPTERQSAIGPDGHAQRGGFLPPVHELPRRMWAGSRVSFPGTLRVGMTLQRRSTILSVQRKEGRESPLVFVTVSHDIGEAGGPALVVDEHDIVYRALGGTASKPPAGAGEPGAWTRMLVPDAVMLFRYSALTFNGHRIHYDRDYVTKVEGYPGLIVHGPLIATLLLDLLRTALPGAVIENFSFRALSPLFDGHEMTLNCATPDQAGCVQLWATNALRGLTMKATATIKPGAGR